MRHQTTIDNGIGGKLVGHAISNVIILNKLG